MSTLLESPSALPRDGGEGGKTTKQRSRRRNANNSNTNNKTPGKKKNEKQQLLLGSVAELLNGQLSFDQIDAHHHSSRPFHLSPDRHCYRPYSSSPSSAPSSFPQHETYRNPTATATDVSQEEQARRSRSDGGSGPTTLVNSTGSSNNSPPSDRSPSHQEFAYYSNPELTRERTPRPQAGSSVDITAIDAFRDDDIRKMITRLAAQYGHASHMGILDRSYRFFVNGARTGVLSYKLQSQVAIVAGDPLCGRAIFADILREFKAYRKRRRWGIVIMGASEAFMKCARQSGWAAMHFGIERVLNPVDNDVLMERRGKRIITQNRQLLDPKKANVSLGVYIPSIRTDPILQRELTGVYDSWRHLRSETARGKSQAFITIYDPFCLPDLMTFIYARGSNGAAVGFAALRRVQDSRGYHLDPCVAAPWAPRGMSELLTYTSMALLNKLSVTSLSFGYEPLQSLGEMMGIPSGIEKMIRRVHHYTFPRLPLAGKKAYHDKFRPDDSQDSAIYLVFPGGVPSLRQVFAVAHVAHISIRKLALPEGKKKKKKTQCEQQQQQQQQKAGPG